MRRSPILGVTSGLLALPAFSAACSTQEIGPTPATFTAVMPEADRGGLMIEWAPPYDTYEQAEVSASTGGNSTLYYAFMDGRQLAYELDGVAFPHTFQEAAIAVLGFLPAGMHHFEIAAAGGGPTVFSGDGEIPPGSTTRLYLFGPRGALHGRFVSFPSQPAPDTVHISVTNLIRTGQRIEAVGCAEDHTCMALSPPLALGESFDADFPGGPSPEGQNLQYALSTGERIGLRQVPSTPLTAPPVQLIYPGIDLGAGATPPANLVAAPTYMSQEGKVRALCE